MFDISLYTSHNSSFTISKDGHILEVLELERFVNIKNVGLMWYLPKVKNSINTLHNVLNYFKVKYNVNYYENLICNPTDVEVFSNYFDTKSLLLFFRAKNLILVDHQEGHSYNAFYQSDLNEGTIISFDGGGNDGCFNYYKGNKKDGLTLYKKNYEYNIGEKYAEIGYHCSSLKELDYFQGYLVHSGKLMGLSGYGNTMCDHIDVFKEYYKGHHEGREGKDSNYNNLKNKLNLPDKLTGQIELDVVNTSQHVFEEVFYDLSKEDIEQSNNNLCLAGGCAMNILNNSKINNITKTFISPNPDDRGLSLGFMLAHLKPQSSFDSTYIGPEVWDKFQLYEYIDKYDGQLLNHTQVINDITSGKILGLVQGRAEHGPRALGNRSIICSPIIQRMKDTLNAKVKNREYYRPFAPVVRLEDISKYFEFEGESKWMSFCPVVKSEWKEILTAITHIDGTARVQTVTREQNELLYDLLTLMNEKTGVGVLLNTSFNIAGKPILNSYKDAIWMLENTQMDGLILEKYYIKK